MNCNRRWKYIELTDEKRLIGTRLASSLIKSFHPIGKKKSSFCKLDVTTYCILYDLKLDILYIFDNKQIFSRSANRLFIS